MSARSFVLLVVLAVICAEFHLTSAFEFNPNQERTLKRTYPSEKKLTLEWKWRLSVGEKVNQATITRYKTTDKDNTDKDIGWMYADGSVKASDVGLIKISGKLGTAESNDGNINLEFEDINNQGYNGAPDSSKVVVTESNYTYVCEVTIIRGSSYNSKITTLIVYVKPTITKAPENVYVDSTKRNVVLRCIAGGKPKPNIVWEIRRPSGTISATKGEELTISKLPGDEFRKTDVGIYTCTATNNAGEVNASAVVQYTECNTKCSKDEKIAIEITDLTFNSDYDNPNSNKYKELKDAIERECMEQYYKAKKTIYSCVVTEFRKGSIVANIKITYQSGTNKPREPLENAIETGKFAGHSVEKKFVSPTSAPTQPTPATDKSTDKPSDSPDSGKRTNSSLSKGAIIAIVVVFSIIFIVIIVVLIVCMLKRRKPAGSHSKPYQEDGKGRTAASAPLKSQPYIDPLYDNRPDKPKDVVYADLNFQDRHTNGGGPPPQYTPSNYAEVIPSQAEQNESGVEWDKSVRDEMWI